jgi:hypothetical protein
VEVQSPNFDPLTNAAELICKRVWQLKSFFMHKLGLMATHLHRCSQVLSYQALERSTFDKAVTSKQLGSGLRD